MPLGSPTRRQGASPFHPTHDLRPARSRWQAEPRKCNYGMTEQGRELPMKRILIAVLAAACIAGAATLAKAGNTPHEEANKKTVIALYEAALNKMDYEESEKYLGPYYKQHNPMAEDGKEGLKKFIEWRKKALPNAKSVIKRIFADGDYVIVHVHSIREP